MEDNDSFLKKLFIPGGVKIRQEFLDNPLKRINGSSQSSNCDNIIFFLIEKKSAARYKNYLLLLNQMLISVLEK